jgi:hypothetical protein
VEVEVTRETAKERRERLEQELREEGYVRENALRRSRLEA